MNVYEAMGIVLAVSPLPENPTEDEENAFDLCRNVVAAYDALAPTPEQWAEHPGAKWYAIDTAEWRGCTSSAAFYQDEPTPDSGDWIVSTGDVWDADDLVLPLGIDWRLCKWSRPEAK